MGAGSQTCNVIASRTAGSYSNSVHSDQLPIAYSSNATFCRGDWWCSAFLHMLLTLYCDIPLPIIASTHRIPAYIPFLDIIPSHAAPIILWFQFLSTLSVIRLLLKFYRIVVPLYMQLQTVHKEKDSPEWVDGPPRNAIVLVRSGAVPPPDPYCLIFLHPPLGLLQAWSSKHLLCHLIFLGCNNYRIKRG